MTQITINENFQPYKYLLVSRVDDSETIVTTRIVISDDNLNQIRVVNIEQGPQGFKGDTGPQGPPGQDAVSFDILPISSGGTNNTGYTSNKIIYYDGEKLLSSSYSIQELIEEASVGGNALTGIVPGTGLYKRDGDNSVNLDVILGEGLAKGSNNEIVVDNTIARLSDLDLGVIEGVVPISKGGTNNNFYSQNKLLYYDGTKIKSFPVETGNIVYSGSSIDVVAGSGLIGGGTLELPNGSVVINIPTSADILVEQNSISLTTTGTPGTYSKVTTDSKGRVVSGASLTEADILAILGYTPFHTGNDGDGSGLDADLLDGEHGSYYRNAASITGILNTEVLPSVVEPGTYTKVAVDSNGLVSNVYYADQQDIIDALGFTPVPNTGSKIITGDTTINGDVYLNGEVEVYDHLPLLATDNINISPDTPRGVSFIYGGAFSSKTGLLAYYPAENQLKLVTNIFASGAETENVQDDLNGGDANSVFILQNLDGDASVVLLRNIADSLYVKLEGNENIKGQKVFEDLITFKKSIYINDPAGNTDPPFNISSNNRKVINLNADLLDDQEGSYYKDASNITGSFSYENVTFDHIEGKHTYLAKFNDAGNDPAGRVDDSNLFQDSNGNINLDNDKSVIIGNATLFSASNSLSVGDNNAINGSNNLVAGSNNDIIGNNSIALNKSSTVRATGSVALGDNGFAYIDNQIAFGNFRKLGSDNQTLEHGQSTAINMHLEGTEIGNSWTDLAPSITIPHNKTFAYRLEVLMTKAFGTGVAQYNFESGIFKNATFRNSNNIVDIINLTTQPQLAKKNEIFNNSQIKNHYHTFVHANGSTKMQDVRVNLPPLSYNNLEAQNVSDYYLYSGLDKTLSGTYYKTNDGNLVLDINKPIYSGNFETSSLYKGIKVTSVNHGIKPGSKVQLRFENQTGLPIADSYFDAFSSTTDNTFFVDMPFYSGYLVYSEAIGESYDYATLSINQNSIVPIDSLYLSSGISGNLQYDGRITNLSDDSFVKKLTVDSAIIIQSGHLFFNRLVTNITSNFYGGQTIEINDPIATGVPNVEQYIPFTGPIKIYKIDYSYDFFKRSSRIQVETPLNGTQFFSPEMINDIGNFQGSQPFGTGVFDLPESISFYTTGTYDLINSQNINTVTGLDYSNERSIIIENLRTNGKIPNQNYNQPTAVVILPLNHNAGSVFFTHKQNISGYFDYDTTPFPKYSCVYTRYKNDNSNYLEIYYPKNDKSINLPYTPIEYELVSGFGSDNNDEFEIENINNVFFLKNKYLFDYETKNIYTIRVKAKDRSNKEFFEKTFNILVNDTRSPYSLSELSDQTIEISSTFNYVIPSTAFNEEDGEGTLAYSAQQQNGESLPSWLSFNPSTRTFNGTPQGCDLGVYNIRVFASNNYSTIYQDFYLTVFDSSITTLANNGVLDASIDDISLTFNKIDENLPSGNIIGSFEVDGSYHPYLDFITASNSFTGIFADNSNIVECLTNLRNYVANSLSGTAGLLDKGSSIDVPSYLNLSNVVVDNIYIPFSVFGTPSLTGNDFYLQEAYKDNIDTFFAGLTVNTSDASLPPEYRIENFNDYLLKITHLTPLSTEEDDESLILTQANNPIYVDSPITTIDYTANTIWGSGYAECDDGILVNDNLIKILNHAEVPLHDISNTDLLHKLNNPPTNYMVSGNILSGSERWHIQDSVTNLVLAMYNVGDPDFCTFLTENGDPIITNDGENLISNNDNHHGTRIEITNAYEIIESIDVVKDNGYIAIDDFDGLLCENNEPLVSDYAFAARQGEVFILLPGSTSDYISLLYSDPINLTNHAYSFAYNWGSLIPSVITNDRYFIKINQKYFGTDEQNAVISYQGILPSNDNYVISGIKNYDYPYQTGDCPVDTTIALPIGFDTSESTSYGYVTGIVDVYTQPATGIVDLHFSKDINLDERDENNLYLYDFQSSNQNLILPADGQYSDLEIINSDVLRIKTKELFFKPNNKPVGTSNQQDGFFSANLDENHGYIEESSNIINRIPIEFNNITNTLSGIITSYRSRPKDYAFDISSISGNMIFVRDDKNYLLKENNRADYFEQPIKCSYLTNGIAFSGSLFNNHSNIYDVRYDPYSLNNHYRNISFEYNDSKKTFSFTTESGNIKPYDHIEISFLIGSPYESDDILGLVLPNMISPKTISDCCLNESYVPNSEQTTLSNVSYAGTLNSGICKVNSSIINRLHSGLLINHSGSNLHGYEINSVIDGFSFSGTIPKNHNILSTNTDLILSDHIGHASVFNVVNDVWYSGAMILKQAESTDIGYVDMYLVDSNVPSSNNGYFGSNNFITSEDLTGVGSVDSPFEYLIVGSGTTILNQYIEFLYLGHNDNTFRLQGEYSLSGTPMSLVVWQNDFALQLEQYMQELNEEEISEDNMVFNTGSVDARIVENLDLELSVKRFDKIKIQINSNSGLLESETNTLDFEASIVNNVTPKPYILDSEVVLNSADIFFPYFNPVENTENSLLDLPFEILPYIKTNHKYCGLDYDKNKQIFFNGNIIELSSFGTIKSFLEKNDEAQILSFNNTKVYSSSGVTTHIHKFNSSDDYYTVSGISIEGEKTVPPVIGGYSTLLEDEYRYNSTFGIADNILLSNTGTAEFVKSVSGDMSVLNYNNFSYHTYGGSTSHYPLDISGAYVKVPQTGTYTVINNSSSCASGTLCIVISGYNTNAFTGIPDIRDRTTFDYEQNTISVGDSKGVLRPFGVDKKLFFDFIDDFPEISNVYYVEDLLSPNVLSVNVPYNSNYIGKSGLVYLIDSDQNIKSHLNPNLNNEFIKSNGSINGLSNINKKIIDYYDRDSKRWKHTIHLSGSQPAYTGYDISLSSKESKFYSINKRSIEISEISYSFGDLDNFTILSSNELEIPDNISEVILKIKTLHGDQSLFDQQNLSMPKVSVSGLDNYIVELGEPNHFGWHGSGWNIGLRASPPIEDYSNKNIIIRTSDLTGNDEYLLNISKKPIPVITPISPSFVASGYFWKLGFDISKINIGDELFNNTVDLDLTGMPDPYNYKIIYSDSRSVVYSGDTTGFDTGVYNLKLVLKDNNSVPLSTGYGVVNVLSHLSDTPDFDIFVNNFNDDYYINLEESELIKLDIPVLSGTNINDANLQLVLNTSEEYDLSLVSSSYNSSTNRYEISIMPKTTGDNPIYLDKTGKYFGQYIQINLRQPVYHPTDPTVYVQHNKTIYFDAIFYKPLRFQPISNLYTIPFDTNEPWSVEFYCLSGIYEHDSNNHPDVRVFNTPNQGIYGINPIEYDLDYEYDSEFKKWKVTAVGYRDVLDRFTSNTGIYNLSLYASDGFNSIQNNDYSIEYMPITQMLNISNNVYATPNNEFFTKADSYNLDETASNDITFPGNLKESSINISNTIRKYDRDFNLWENSYTSQKMTDKYDAQIVFNGDELTVQCKGIGKDKVITVAKLHTIEIESNELQGLPLTITGIVGWPDTIEVNQGNEAWELKFYTIGGLAHPEYPPKIILQDMPTFCTGYDPLIETQLQCLVSEPEWDANYFGGGWFYHFSGLPSCTLLGVKEFSITAIDTDPNLLPESPYLPNTDFVEYAFEYIEGAFAGSPPFINEEQVNGLSNTTIKPFCGSLYYKKLNFGPGEDALCIGPTGLKDIDVSGNLPPGLSYKIYFSESLWPDSQPVVPFSSLDGGYLIISGDVTEYANGGSYDEEFKLTVTDARDLSAEQTITFTDSSVPNDPDKSIAVYFDKPYAVLTPKSGLDIVAAASVNGYSPPLSPEGLICNSTLPHNQCGVIEVEYLGSLSTDTRVWLTPTDPEVTLTAGNLIYIGFRDTNNDDLDGVYQLAIDNEGIHITGIKSLTSQNTGYADLVIGNYTNISLSNYDTLFNGTITNNKCLLGAGRIEYPSDGNFNNSKGLVGYIVPSFITSLRENLPFTTSDSKLLNLKFDRIPNDQDIISSLQWVDCPQTGTLYMSGIALPPIYCEITDPPPAQNRPFTFNNLKESLLTRLSFGETEAQRNIPENNRVKTINYQFYDMLSGTMIADGSVSAGQSFSTPTLFRESGTVYRLKIFNNSDIFPTYNYQAIPYSENEYVWIHKAALLNDLPVQNTYPPIISIIESGNSISVINDLEDSDPNGVTMSNVFGLAIGGYIPVIYDGNGIPIISVPYSHIGTDGWSTEDYKPLITGVIHQKLFKDNLNNLSASYEYKFASASYVLTIDNVGASVGDIIYLEIFEVASFGGAITLKYQDKRTISSVNISENNLVFDRSVLDLGGSAFTGFANIKFGTTVNSIDTNNNQIILNRGPLEYSDNVYPDVDNLQRLDPVCIDANSFISTELSLLINPGDVTVASGTSSLIYIENSSSSTDWLSEFNQGDFVTIYKNINENIKILPENLTFIKEGEFLFEITGNCNNFENIDFLFKVGIAENPNMPIFDSVTYPSVNFTPKKYFINYPLHVNKPIKIIDSTVARNGDILTFSLLGGKRPIKDNAPDIKIAAGYTTTDADFSYCGFWRKTVGTGNIIQDVYDSINDRLNVELTLHSDYGYDWSTTNIISIRVEDETGKYINTYNLNP